MDTIQKIYEILSEINPEEDFKSGKNFVLDGLLDSFDITMLVARLEEEFGVDIPADAMRPENFFSAESIEGLVRVLNSL